MWIYYLPYGLNNLLHSWLIVDSAEDRKISGHLCGSSTNNHSKLNEFYTMGWHFDSDWTISTTVGLIKMQMCSDTHVAQRRTFLICNLNFKMDCNEFWYRDPHYSAGASLGLVNRKDITTNMLLPASKMWRFPVLTLPFMIVNYLFLGPISD